MAAQAKSIFASPLRRSPVPIIPGSTPLSAKTCGPASTIRQAGTHGRQGMPCLIGADPLAFLSVDGIYRAMGYARRDPVRPQFTDHCFTGNYPTPLTDQLAHTSLPRQLSLLAEAS